MALARWNAALQDEDGNVMDGASIEVRLESTGNLVSVFSDRDGVVPLGNPFTAADGSNIGFHVVGGAYKITATLGAFSKIWRYVAIGLAAELDEATGDETGILFAEDFGVVGDGVTDNTTNLQAAENSRSTLGLILAFRGGIYKTGPIAIDRELGGAWVGFGYTRFTPTANSQTMFTLSNAITSDTLGRGFSFRNLSINGNGFTGITAIAEVLAKLTTIENVMISAVEWAAQFDRGSGITLKNIEQAGTGSWLFSDTTGSSTIGDITIDNMVRVSNGGIVWGGASWLFFNRSINVNVSNINSSSLDGAGVGITVQGPCEGLFITNAIILYPTTGIRLIADGGGNSPFYVNLTNFAVDQPTVDGMNLRGTAIRLTNVNVTNGAQRTNSGGGIVVKAQAVDVTMVGVRVQNNNNDGIEIETGASKVKMTALELISNHVAAGVDLDLQASTVANVVLFGENSIGTFTATGQTLSDERSAIASQGYYGSSSGTTVLQASATASGALALPAATDTLVGKATTDTFTNKTFDTAGTGNSLLINGLAATANTGTGAVVRATSPTLVTPVLGVATATSINKVVITAPATSATLTIADGKTLTANSSLTLTGTDGKTLTVSNSGTLAGGDAFVLAIAAGKTLTASNTLTFTGTDATSFAFPSTSGTVVTLDATQELDNKTLDSSVAKGTWTASGTWTIPAVTLGGTVAGGGNQINNVVIGASSPLAGSFTTVSGSTSVTSPLVIGGSGTTGTQLTIKTTTGNGTTDAIAFVGGNNGATTLATFTKGSSANVFSFNGEILPGTGTFTATVAKFYTNVGGGGLGLVITPVSSGGTNDLTITGIGGTTIVAIPAATNQIDIGAVSAKVRFPSITTTASAANAFLDSGDGNNLLRSTSSRRYKTGIADLTAEDIGVLTQLRPIKFHSNVPTDDAEREHFGLIAEEVAEVDSRLVHLAYFDDAYDIEDRDVDGVQHRVRTLKTGAKRVPDGVQYDRLTVLLIAIVNQHERQIKQLLAATCNSQED